MAVSITIDRVHIKEVLTALQQEETRCRLEAVEGFCPDLRRDQIYLAIDYLNRAGLVCLTLDISGTYWVRA